MAHRPRIDVLEGLAFSHFARRLMLSEAGAYTFSRLSFRMTTELD